MAPVPGSLGVISEAYLKLKAWEEKIGRKLMEVGLRQSVQPSKEYKQPLARSTPSEPARLHGSDFLRN